MNKVHWIQPEDSTIGRYQKKISDITGSDTFCILPWMHFATRPNGDMRLCCNSNSSGAGEDHTIGLVKNETGSPANFGRETPMSAWNNDYMKSVRTTMLSGEIPASCTKCFAEESKHVVSKRIWETGTWMEDGYDIGKLVDDTEGDGTVPEKLAYLDLRLGHTCNIKCIMCSPHDSSRWVADHKKLIPILSHESLRKQMAWDSTKFNNSWYENPDFWKEMYAQIPNLKQVYFAGGEPLMIKEHRKFVEEIIRQGYHDKIQLRYNTNGLLLNDDIIDLWKNFKQVKIGFSVDALTDRNAYIRYPSNWDTIVRNLHKLDNTPDNIHVSIATAIQIMNIKHLPEFAKWKITQGFTKVNLQNVYNDTEAGGGIFNMHLLYIPTWLSITTLPKKDKEEVHRIFAEFKEWLYVNYRTDENFWETNPYGWKRWQAILDFMDGLDNSKELSAFSEYVTKMDGIRNTKFIEIFPELAHLIYE